MSKRITKLQVAMAIADAEVTRAAEALRDAVERAQRVRQELVRCES